MGQGEAEFEAVFEHLTGFGPMGWQRRLFEDFRQCGPERPLPVGCDIPTGLGKTAVMALWLIAQVRGAKVPRRLVYVVDRRAVVDQATDFAVQLREKAKTALGLEALPISTLRGQYADNKEWLAEPASPAIVVGTVDMIGSRLLFEGYQVTRRMRPFHAGLLGADTLVVLDEAHLCPPFEALLSTVQSDDRLRPQGAAPGNVAPPFCLLSLSATGRERAGAVFRLSDEDRSQDSVVKKRLTATKHLIFRPLESAKLEERLAAEAWDLHEKRTQPVRVLVYCNSREVAQKVRDSLAAKGKKDGIAAELFVGARRVKEREDAKARLEQLGFFSGNQAPERSAFVVATSAGEVGVDLDADHMVMDLVPFERMVQRLGRVNRLGEKDSRVAVVEAADDKLPQDIQKRAAACADLLRGLPPARGGEPGRLPFIEEAAEGHDASPGALLDLRERRKEEVKAATSPAPLYPALTRALVDAWSMTSLKEHAGRPEVAPWLRGWEQEEPPQTTVIWRSYLPVREHNKKPEQQEVEHFFDAAAPHLTEKLETYTHRVADWLIKRAKVVMQALKKKENLEELEVRGVPTLTKDSIVAVLPDRERFYTLHDLAELDGKGKKDLEGGLAGATLVLDSRLGGLTEGLLDDKAALSKVSAADGEDGWSVDGTPLAPFRVRWIEIDQQKEPEDQGKWRSAYSFVIARDDEGIPQKMLQVDVWPGETADEDSRGLASKEQSLKEHQEWVARKAQRTVEALRLPEPLAQAVVLAARLHDEGKQAERWQDAFHAPRGPASGRPYAKTASRRAPDFSVLRGYRHEFGSLFHLDGNNVFGALDDEMKDLVRHLVVAHHGHARPVIRTDGCDMAPPSVLDAEAREVALRFARLQRRFGPWGLAWLEALVRAADQQASKDLEKGLEKDLEKGRTPDG